MSELDLSRFEGSTPGPWLTSLDAPMSNPLYRGIMAILEYSGVGAKPGNRLVAVLVEDDDRAWGTTEQETIEANARLMAAAPDLLAEVERLRAERDAWRESMINWLRRTGYVVFGGKTPGGEPKFRLTDKGRAALPPRTGGVGHEA